MYDWEIFQASYKAATEEDKKIVDSDTITFCVRSVIAANQLDTSNYSNLVTLYSLFILRAVTEPILIEEIRKLGIPDGKKVFVDLENCKNSKPANAETVDDLADDIAEAEEAINKIPQMRTMAADMATTHSAEEVVHSSAQENILNKN